MSEDELQDRLLDRLNGTPQTRPDERRQYLGSLRERVALAVTNAEITRPETLALCRQVLAEYGQQAGFKLLINGKLEPAQTAPYMQAASQAGLAFTSINDDTAQITPAAFALLLVAKNAIDHQDIRLHYPETPAEPKKRSFFDRFQH
ncbi:DUF1694 domain-containing protein [Lacticaseibacillus baoqingensis]|uniref:DUF1694 domain-containing protein n=1 Tax=Lacticaseibacillus baoqingensis TaxID=2486013 RepID=A0ABW4E530_9LACO|nr:YueI family protein [Lacticaseibacillus baoqingensis]